MASGSGSTPKKVSFHLVEQNYATNSIERALAAGSVTQRDIDLIQEFVAEKRSCDNITTGRANKITYTLLGWRRFLGPFDKNTIADIYSAKTAIESAENHRGTPFKQNTLHDWTRILKQFYMWLIENEYTTISEHKLRKMSTPPKDTMTKVASDLLTPEEIADMIRACKQNVDRALIMMLYEGGFRIGEIGKMKWGDIAFDQYGVIANVNFKTGKPRYIRLIMAVQYLAAWRAEYPGTAEGDSLVFINTKREPFIHATIRKRLNRVAEHAGIQKHITPHIFRHSRITHLIKEGVPESVIKLMMWGNITTEMFKTYAHLTGMDIDAAMLKAYGIEIADNKKKESRLEPRQCKNCYTVHPPTSSYCSVCGRSLTEEAVATENQMQKSVLDTPEAIQAYVDDLVEKKMREKGVQGV